MRSIQSIIIRPEKKGVPQRINEAKIHIGGIDGDHYAKPEGHRQVTLIAASDLATVAASVGFQGDAHIASRRNICVDTLPDGDLVGKKVSLGDDVLLEITCYCNPCKRMNENFGDGAVDAFDNKAGWGAIVLREGAVQVGDLVSIT
jgi:MOSC domain-containing protein YiiM